MGDSSKPRHRPAHFPAANRRAGRATGDGGFTLIEVMIAVALLVIMMVPFANAYITTLSTTADAHGKEVAAMVADSALDQARALDATDQGGSVLVSQRDQTSVATEWSNPAPGTSSLLAETASAYDASASSGSGATAPLPTSPQTVTVGSQKFQVYYYVGNCWEPGYTEGGETSNTCTDPASPPSTDYEMYRVIIDVTWTAPQDDCGSSGCYYVASTLISGSSDPLFDVNPTIPLITSADTTTFTIGTAGSFEITTTGFPPPTYSNVAYGNGACTPSANLPSSITLTANTGLLSGTPGSGTAGTYTICINATNTDGTGTQTFSLVIVKATPTVTLTVPGNGTLGTVITAGSVTAGLTTGYKESGSLQFSVFGPQSSPPTSCSTGGTSLGSATLSGNGSYQPTNGFTPTTAGDYWWYASYAGDANNNAAASTCGAGMAETVVGTATPTLTASAPSTGTTGTAIATTSIGGALAGGYSPSGTLTFSLIGPQATTPTSCTGGTLIGSATVTANGTYHPSSGFTPLLPGDYWLYASYSGDSNNTATTSSCTAMPETVVSGLAIPSLNVVPPASGTLGTALTASSVGITISGGSAPTGTVTIYVVGPQGSSPTSCSGGTAAATVTVNGDNTYQPSSLSFTPTTAGGYWWYASYSGDSNNKPVTSSCNPMPETSVGQATPALSVTSGPSSGTVGTAVSATPATVKLSSGYSPTGTVTLALVGPSSSAPSSCSGASTAATIAVSGDGTYSPSSGSFTPTQAGNYWWYATYGGDTNNSSVASTCGPGMPELVISKVSPTLTASGPASGTAGTAIAASSIGATLAGGYSPTGTITYTVFGPQSTAPTSCSSGGTTVGTATVTANKAYNPSAGFTPVAAGDYWWYASYGGDTNNNTAASPCGSTMSETLVAKASPTLTVGGPASGTFGTAIAASSVNATLAGGSAPTGTITYTVFGPQSTAPTSCSSGGTTVGTSSAGSGNPSSGFTPAAAGDYWWYASYGGDTNNNAAASPCGSTMSETVVGKATSTVKVASVLSGTTLTFTATVTTIDGVTPTGTVTWAVTVSSGTAPTCPASSLNSSGQATCQITSASSHKTYSVTASYGGDGNYSTGSGSDNNVTG